MRKQTSTPNVRSKRRKTGRKSHGRGQKHESQELWLYGLHAVAAALKNPSRECRDILVTHDGAARLAKTLDSLTASRIPALREVGTGDIESVLFQGAVHQGIALKVERLTDASLEDACVPATGARSVVVVLDHVTDPHNVGAILRSAAAFGAKALMLTQSHAPAESGSLAKAASGALDTIPYVRVVNLARALDQLAELGYWRIGLAAQAKSTLAESDLSGNVALVLGAEGSGLRAPHDGPLRSTGQLADKTRLARP